MADPLTIAGFPDVLDPRFREISDGAYKEGEDMIPRFYTAETPTQTTERGSALTGMGLWSTFGGTITYDGPDQGYAWSSGYQEYAKGMQIERALVEYDQFAIIDKLFRLLGVSARNTRQIEAAATFTNAFVVDSGYTTDEGLALCSDAHTSPRSSTSTTTGFDNLTTAAFSPTALKAIKIQLMKLKQDNGQPIDNHVADTVVGPVDLVDRAEEIFGTVDGLDVAEGTKNVLKNRYTYVPWIRLTNTRNFFVCNGEMMKENLVWFDKVKPEFSRMEDFSTIVALYRGYGIWHRARKDWRWLVGANVG